MQNIGASQAEPKSHSDSARVIANFTLYNPSQSCCPLLRRSLLLTALTCTPGTFPLHLRPYLSHIMANYAEHLPPAIEDAVIQELLHHLGLPVAAAIDKLSVAAQFHGVYLLSFTSSDLSRLWPATTTDLILRVSGTHIPTIKTRNEVACLSWVGKHTSIPVPTVVRWDATSSNLLGHEYMLLDRVPGKSVDAFYDSLDDEHKETLVRQLAQILVQMHNVRWEHVGGLTLDDADIEGASIRPGPVLDETFWQPPDIKTFWDPVVPGETFASLNVGGPFGSYTAYAAAQLSKYAHAISKHPNLEFVRDLLPRVKRLVLVLQDASESLTATIDSSQKYVLAHRDLHLGNVMYNLESRLVTGVLDWEFASVVPERMWNPVRCFLWNARETPDSKSEQQKLLHIFKTECTELGAFFYVEGIMERRAGDDECIGQEAAQQLRAALHSLLLYLGGMVNHFPRGNRLDRADTWKIETQSALHTLGF